MPFTEDLSLQLFTETEDEHHWTDARDDELAGLWAGKARLYTETFGSTHWR